MIFVTVGTQEPFTRLIRAVDDWAAGGASDRKVVAQVGEAGLSEYTPQRIEAFARTPPAEFDRYMRDCALIVAHAGMGSILSALSLGKPIVVMPRRAALGEHRNEHQLATVKGLGERPGLYVAMDETALGVRIEAALAHLDQEEGAASPPFAQDALIRTLRDFITG